MELVWVELNKLRPKVVEKINNYLGFSALSAK